jgi:predicted DNA-binding transcriptional regulator AlpA
MNFITIPEAAKKIGKSRKVIDEWISRKDDPLPCIRCGERGTLVVEEEFDVYVIKHFHIAGNKKVERLLEY